MRKLTRWILLLLLVLPAMPAVGQKGTGELTGIARQGITPEIVILAGTLKEIRTAPCEQTTGRSPLGTHLIVNTRDRGEVNIHLGTASAVATAVGNLKTGQKITVQAFRTDRLAANAYIAKSFTAGGEVVALRDDSLRPFWAAQSPGVGQGRGQSFRGGSGGGRGLGGGRGPNGTGRCRRVANV